MDANHELSFIIAARLKQLREEAGLSHQKLSKELGTTISRDSLMNYEVSHEHHSSSFKNLGMSVNKLYALATYYNVSADYILGLTNTRSPSADVQAACDTTGLSEKSIYLLRNFMEPSDDNHFSYYEKYGTYSAYAFELIDEFIAYALDHHKGIDIPFGKYLVFRQQRDKHNKNTEIFHKMDLSEMARHSTHLVQAFDSCSKNDILPLLPADASNFYKREFLDNFKTYLEAKYPLAQSPQNIPGFSNVEEED